MSPAMPLPGATSPVSQVVAVPQRSLPADLSAEPPATFTQDSIDPHASHAGGSGVATGKMSAAGNQAAAKTAGRASLSGPASDTASPQGTGRSASTGENLDGAISSVSGQTKSWAEGEDAPSTVRNQLQAEEPIQSLTPDQNQTQAQHGSQKLELVAAPIGGEGAVRGFTIAETALQSGPSRPVLPVSGTSGLSNGGRTSGQAVPRLVYGPGTLKSASPGSRSLEGQPLGMASNVSAEASITASTLARDPASAHGASNAAVGTAEGLTAAGPGTRETFAALDAEAAPGAPVWTHAGSQRAEAGFQDPALGWVGVRADLGGGGVHAALVPGSADAAEALGGHLAGLNSYLAEHHTPVETLTLAAPEGRWAGSQGADQGMRQGMNQGEGQNPGQGSFSEPQSNPAPSAPNPIAAPSPDVSARSGTLERTALPGGPAGVHISVMA
jgi:hypothetical protein